MDKDTLLAYLIYKKDVYTRHDLFRKIINKEDDYTSALVTRIRDACYSLGLECFSAVLPPAAERALGVDFVIILRIEGKIKICMIEAKWPRYFRSFNRSWDQVHKKRGISHFSEQLQKQSKIPKSVSIWELFQNELEPGVGRDSFDPFGASMVSHGEAISYMHNASKLNSAWTNSDIKAILQIQQKNLFQVILNLLKCNYGEPFTRISANGYYFANSPELEFRIPIPGPSVRDNESTAQITEFMTANGLSNYLYIDLTENDPIIRAIKESLKNAIS